MGLILFASQLEFVVMSNGLSIPSRLPTYPIGNKANPVWRDLFIDSSTL